MKSISTIFVLATITACTGTQEGIPGTDGNDGRSGTQGDAGPPGPQGPQGIPGTAAAKGDPGKDGTDNRIVKSWKCDFKKDIVSLPIANQGNAVCNASIDFWYYARETAAGDTYVRAGVDVYRAPDHASDDSGLNGASSSELWQAGSWEGDNGADWLLEEACRSNPGKHVGNWEFLLNKASNRLTVTYTDADITGGKASFDSYCQ